jgi:hypothetical protein
VLVKFAETEYDLLSVLRNGLTLWAPISVVFCFEITPAPTVNDVVNVFTLLRMEYKVPLVFKLLAVEVLDSTEDIHG